jgi:hypothetical protein
MAIGGFVCSLIGIFSFYCAPLLGILGLIFSGIALSGMSKSGNPDGKGMAVAGLVIGIIDVAGGALVLIIIAAANA